MVKNLPAMWETWVWSLGQEDPLEKGMAIHSSTVAWRIPRTEEPGRLQSIGLQRVGYNWATNTLNFLTLTLNVLTTKIKLTLTWLLWLLLIIKQTTVNVIFLIAGCARLRVCTMNKCTYKRPSPAPGARTWLEEREVAGTSQWQLPSSPQSQQSQVGLGSPGHGGSVLPTSAWLSGPWFNQQLQQEQLPGLFGLWSLPFSSCPFPFQPSTAFSTLLQEKKHTMGALHPCFIKDRCHTHTHMPHPPLT